MEKISIIKFDKTNNKFLHGKFFLISNLIKSQQHIFGWKFFYKLQI
jgi:hypothetical protein